MLNWKSKVEIFSKPVGFELTFETGTYLYFLFIFYSRMFLCLPLMDVLEWQSNSQAPQGMDKM
jgi:hypothetical protein